MPHLIISLKHRVFEFVEKQRHSSHLHLHSPHVIRHMWQVVNGLDNDADIFFLSELNVCPNSNQHGLTGIIFCISLTKKKV